ncbi:hypothetical protein DICVIV_04275 [Dictyocaulus viviparus]|uniref:Uncharacterized protein n=1 Tax=Dictyocaulus viviparus TaxID=29172 RepID=A0A0D8XY64_DICVI|nr:hypothetical protein DICVIV_04275 [Dictyocaulus viviparus]
MDYDKLGVKNLLPTLFHQSSGKVARNPHQADAVSPVVGESCTKTTSDALLDGEAINHCCAVNINGEDEDVETPLGRLVLEWKRREGKIEFSRTDGVRITRSVVPLCRVSLLHCPVSISGSLMDPLAATVRNPIRAVELTASFDLADMYMFCGEKRKTFLLLPYTTYSIVVVVLALTAGRLPFPKITLTSPEISDETLQHITRALPANIFVLASKSYVILVYGEYGRYDVDMCMGRHTQLE